MEKEFKSLSEKIKKKRKPEFEDTEYRQCWSDGYNVCLDEIEEGIKEFIKIICKDWFAWDGGDFSKKIKERAGDELIK